MSSRREQHRESKLLWIWPLLSQLVWFFYSFARWELKLRVRDCRLSSGWAHSFQVESLVMQFSCLWGDAAVLLSCSSFWCFILDNLQGIAAFELLKRHFDGGLGEHFPQARAQVEQDLMKLKQEVPSSMKCRAVPKWKNLTKQRGRMGKQRKHLLHVECCSTKPPHYGDVAAFMVGAFSSIIS